MFLIHRPTIKQVCSVLFVIGLITLPLFIQNTSYAYVIRILGLVGLYMIVALGLNIVVGFLGLLDLGFMAFYAVGAYSMALLSTQGWSFGWALLASIAITMGVRALLGAPVLRLRGDYLAIVTLGFGEITRIILNNWDSLTNGPRGISLFTHPNVKPVSIFGINISTNVEYFYLIYFFVIVCVIVSQRLLNSRMGRAWTAIREDEVAARLCGIQMTRMKMIGFIISAAFAGIAGGIYARWESFVTPISFSFWESVMLVTMVVIGGMGSIPGTLLGVAIVIMVPELLRNILGSDFVSWRHFIFGAALVLVAVFRPQGLLPSRTISRELETKKDDSSSD